MAKITSASSVAGFASAEQPTSSAKITINLRPYHISATAEGAVPAAQAPSLITTLGTVAIGVAGMAGADLSLHLARGLGPALVASLAFAQLALALFIAVLITRHGSSLWQHKRGGVDTADTGRQLHVMPNDDAMLATDEERGRLSSAQDDGDPVHGRSVT